jgi:hypothetical protein
MAGDLGVGRIGNLSSSLVPLRKARRLPCFAVALSRLAPSQADGFPVGRGGFVVHGDGDDLPRSVDANVVQVLSRLQPLFPALLGVDVLITSIGIDLLRNVDRDRN